MNTKYCYLLKTGLVFLLVMLLSSTLQAQDLVFDNIRVFDGDRMHQPTRVVVSAGRIVGIGNDLAAPAGAERIDGADHTLMPGLIDAHTHSWGNALQRSIVFGVTTVIDQFTDPAIAARWRQEQRDGQAMDRADIVSAGMLATAPEGHGTQFGTTVVPLTNRDQIEDWVNARQREGSDFIKIVIEDGSLMGRPLPTLDESLVTALVDATHQRGLLAVAHITRLNGAELALRAGVDGLVHLFNEQPAPETWLDKASASGLFVTPTLTVLESTLGRAGAEHLIDDADFAPLMLPEERGALRMHFPGQGGDLNHVFTTVRQLHHRGVTILAGSDAPNPGTTHGVSLHRELALLVQAGLPPLAALRSATSEPARIYRLNDRGRIAPGMRADLLMVRGNPQHDISHTRAIVGVWKQGRSIARLPAVEAGHPTLNNGNISDFENGDLNASNGAWFASTDQIMGGQSVVTLEQARDQDNGYLRSKGQISSGFAFPWAGPMYSPTNTPMQAADLSAFSAVRFRVRAAQPVTLRVLAFADSLGQFPSSSSVDVSNQWQTITLPFSQFPGFEATGFRALLWTPGPQPQAFQFDLDDIALIE
ncbi:MAG: hypothetical protein Tsb002_38610 [Wenzhouxiangellaceae bacterium]